ncbi:MAG: hypothetical protein J6T27_00240 [Alphaproteobacteria bacterium]|nr:hypothetical protein [Alphaproteobacteria bacterium]
MLSLHYRLLRLFYAALDKYNQRREAKAAAERVKNEKCIIARREYKEREETQNFLFLALLQTMCKVCEELKPIPYVTRYNGWLKGDAVRALTDEPDPIKPIYEICLKDPKSNSGINLYNLEVCQQTPKFKQIYSVSNRFVSDKNLPYLRAVFDLTARRNISSPERAQNLEELKNIKVNKSRYWNDYPEARAIEYLESLLPKKQSK